MNNQPIRVAILGSGKNTRSKHIPNLQAIQGVQIVSVCNRSRESSEKAAKQFGIPKIHDNWQELIADPDTNALVIGTWPNMHCPATLAALAVDKHVLCEARMAASADQARRMRDAARDKPHLIAQIVPSPLLGLDRTIQKLLADGAIGEILAIDMQVGGDFIDHNSPMHWREDVALSGVNIMGLGIKYEALMRWVGPATHVFASGKIFTKMRKDADGVLRAVRVPEHLDVVADMACGAQLHIQMSSVTGLVESGGIYLFGSDGTLRIGEKKLFLGRRGDKELKEVQIPAEDQGRWRVEEEFINAIRGTEKVKLTTLDDGVKYMEFTEAVACSVLTGRRYALPLSETSAIESDRNSIANRPGSPE